MTVIASGIVFAVMTGGTALYELHQNTEKHGSLGLGESVGRPTARGRPEDFKTEAATARPWLYYIKPRYPWAF